MVLLLLLMQVLERLVAWTIVALDALGVQQSTPQMGQQLPQPVFV